MHRVSSSLMFGFGVALVAMAAVSAQNPGGSEEGKKMKNPVASSADSIAAGQAAFTKNCRFCQVRTPRATVRWRRKTRIPRI